MRKRVVSLISRLNKYYPIFKPKIRRDPLDELVLTLLSQNTNDNLSFEAFRQLKKRYKSWDEVAKSSIREIEKMIHIAGLAPTKSKRLKELLKIIAEKNASERNLKKGSPYHLDFLAKMEMDDARKYLTSLKGIGEKTAACVILFSFQKPAFPIDTHVLRILKRQGIIPLKMTAEKAHEFMYRLTKPDDRYKFHVNLITYGRQICHARNPECDKCVIKSTCKFVVQP